MAASESLDYYYGVLGVEPGASPEEIRRAYRTLARALHPDRNPDPDARERFAKVTTAFEVLSLRDLDDEAVADPAADVTVDVAARPEPAVRSEPADVADVSDEAEAVSLDKASDEASDTASEEPAAADTDDTDTDTKIAAGGSRVPLVTAVIALVAGLAVAVAGVVLFLNRGSGDSAAQQRDNVLLSAEQDIKVLNTMDYRNVPAGLQRWADASTGELHSQLTSGQATAKTYLQKAQDVTTAQVKDAAIITFDPKDGTAEVIASVYVTVTPKSGKAQINRERLLGELTLVGSQWKLSSLGQVAVGS